MGDGVAVSFYMKRGSPVGRRLPPVGELREKNFRFGGMEFKVGSVDEFAEQIMPEARTWGGEK
jgi:hypothetical protein